MHPASRNVQQRRTGSEHIGAFPQRKRENCFGLRAG